jgi:hypothetical protein
MNSSLDCFSFEFVMQLYRSKRYAEANNYKMALRILKVKYPDIFMEDFEDFIDKLSCTISVIDDTKNTNFIDMLEPKNDLGLPEN